MEAYVKFIVEVLFVVLKSLTYMIAAYPLGQLVLKGKIKVNYTRKILHFIMLLMPLLFDLIKEAQLEQKLTIDNILLNALVTVALLSLFHASLRRRFAPLDIAFVAIDRPEDRPLTLTWLITQVIAAYAVMLVIAAVTPQEYLVPVLLIPLIVIGLGDGLAEPVGVRFGKHAYATRALFSKKTYSRTLEGSLCVFVASIGALMLYADHFTPVQLLILFLILPLAMTLAEAFSPHTWDTPFLLVVGSGLIMGLLYV